MATTACSTLCFPQPPRRALKRGPNDLLPIANGGILVMTADTDAKKAKLDSSVGAVSAAGAPPPPCFAPSATIVPSSQTQSSSATIFPHIPSGQLMATLTAGAAAIPNLNGLTDPSQITATNVAVPAPKSKVVHLRNIPSDFTDLELLQFCLPFGNIVNYLLLKGKNQAFVEYGLLDEAQRIVIATEAYPVAIRGRTMFVQYSTHQELKTDRSPPSQPPATAVDEPSPLSSSPPTLLAKHNNIQPFLLLRGDSVFDQAALHRRGSDSISSFPWIITPLTSAVFPITGITILPSNISSGAVLGAKRTRLTSAVGIDLEQLEAKRRALVAVATAATAATVAAASTQVAPVAATSSQPSPLQPAEEPQPPPPVSSGLPRLQPSSPTTSATTPQTPAHFSTPSQTQLFMAASPVRPLCGVPTTSSTVGGGEQNGTATAHNNRTTIGPAHHYADVYQQHSLFVMDQMRAAAAVGMLPPHTAQPQHIHDMQQVAQNQTNLLVLSNGGSSTGNGTSGVTSASQLDISGSGTQQQPNAVLRVIIENMICPVTLDLLHSIFSRFGKVLRIITFNKNNTFQALIQLSEANAAQHARDTLNGHQVYSGCCTLRIDYSKLATLNVKYNNDKSRDYTNPNLPSGELTLEQQLSLVTAAAAGQLPASLGSIVPSPFAFPFGAPPAAQYAVPQHTIQANDAALSGAALGPLLSTSATANAANHAALNVAAGLRFPPVSAILTISPVILVSNLDETKVTPDALFTLFGVYGDVQRVKILFNKKDNALIQYAEPQQAQLAIQHLDKIRWHEKTVRVAPSKHTNVQMPKEGQPDAGLTRDYSQSPLHRFKKPGSKNYMNIYPPSCTLHLSNIPPNITEEFLMQAFEEREFAVKGFKFFPKDHKMALVQLEDVETAINALIEMHNFKLAENAHLRVSFSKSGI
ncbi:hypothetical protein QR680_000603 [Steinernema hermaphroditum]|uniref:RRM domain-containing protein n=1 Tax=Steinernema hermaphroditum TaxID=289476 RepID=A0AA39LEG7_9BILA|nr:hypothetical protein QR680_000603 [Steinernema hermaphroditum]